MISSPSIVYRKAEPGDAPAISLLRACTSGSPAGWHDRIHTYMQGTHHPQQALQPRVVIVAAQQERLVGLIAGHLTRRFDCDGELQWLDVHPEHRRQHIATNLFDHLARWFRQQNARRICVNVAPDNLAAQAFYRALGAQPLNEHWLVWHDLSA